MKKTMKIARTVTLMTTLISLFVTIDLGFQFAYNLLPERDGYAAHGMMQSVFHIFGDHDWTLEKFFSAFEQSAWFTMSVLILHCTLGIGNGLMNGEDS